MLPDGSGLDICNQIKSNPEITAPVIIMSATAKIDQMKNHCYPDDFIAKPFDLMKLVERINDLTTSNSLQE
ncbi:Response regulator receiver domain-containing protein [Chryseobacterium arachidis]|uniref:Response regulator receiver domain-containing protein n=1 Tax=Chryseobacterium arachidis TaxID=1416778 RepID=A0A1M5C714_9FLAO|nr:response regulator [Chryseobacterium arachidis]SHF50446.1 Response regulator receiver domain-containing protein [Chryseobacterium arachidis]